MDIKRKFDEIVLDLEDDIRRGRAGWRPATLSEFVEVAVGRLEAEMIQSLQARLRQGMAEEIIALEARSLARQIEDLGREEELWLRLGIR